MDRGSDGLRSPRSPRDLLRRFTQPDDLIQNVYNPQDLNRYSYVRNNPLRYTDPTGHAVVFANDRIGSTLLSAPRTQQRKVQPAPIRASTSLYTAVQSAPVRQTGTTSSAIVPAPVAKAAAVLGNVTSSPINSAKSFILQPQQTRGLCISANLGMAAFGTCSGCVVQTLRREIGGTFNLGGGGTTGFVSGVGGFYMSSNAKSIEELKGQNVLVGGSAWVFGADYSWDRDNPDIKSFNRGVSIGPDSSPEFGPAAVVEGHGGSTYTWGKTFYKFWDIM